MLYFYFYSLICPLVIFRVYAKASNEKVIGPGLLLYDAPKILVGIGQCPAKSEPNKWDIDKLENLFVAEMTDLSIPARNEFLRNLDNVIRDLDIPIHSESQHP